MAMPFGEKLVTELKSLRDEASNFRNGWQELSDFLNPRAQGFTTEWSPGTKRRTRLYDSTAEDAGIRFATGLSDALTSEGQQWFFLKAIDEELNKNRAVRLWLDEVQTRLLAVFNSPFSGFHSSQFEKYHSLGCYGTGIQFIGDKPGLGPFFQTQFLGWSYIDTDEETGRADVIFREFDATPRQAHKIFGKRLPAATAKLIDDPKNGQKTTRYYHAVKPREDVRPFGQNATNLPWGSWWGEVEKASVIRESGYTTFPYVVPRWTKNAQEKYGRGPGHVALSDARLVNRMEEVQLVALEKIVDPPLLISTAGGFLRTIDLRPGAQNRIDASFQDVNKAVAPLLTGANPAVGEAKEAQKREQIRRAFYLDIFELPGPVAADGDVLHMSPVEIATRNRDRLRILGPIYSRLKAEDLSPMMGRTLSIMERNRMLPPIPPELVEAGELDVEYVNPMAIAQGSGEVGAILQTFDALAPMAQADPSILDVFNFDQTARIIGDKLHAPTKIFRTKKEMQEIREARAKAAEEERNAQLNEMDSKSVKNVAQAAQ